MAERENKLYMCSSSRFHCEWFILNLDTQKGKEFREIGYTTVEASCVIIGSRIYIVGGRERIDLGELVPVDTVRVFNLSTHAFEEAMRMSAPRTKPLLVPLVSSSGKQELLVFGGRVWDKAAWGERYDFQTNRWSEIADPPLHVQESGNLLTYAIAGSKIVLWNNSCFSIYYPDTGNWFGKVCGVNPTVPGYFGTHFSCIPTNVAVFGNLLFWFYGSNLHVYDLNHLEQMNSPLCSLISEGYKPDPSSFAVDSNLSHFLLCTDGARLCMLWPCPHTHNRVSWTSFQIGRDPTSCTLTAVRDDFGSFPIPSTNICHILAPPQDPVDDVFTDNQDDLLSLKKLSTAMHLKSYISLMRTFDEQCYLPPEPHRSTKSENEDEIVKCLLEFLNLENEEEIKLKKEIQESALQCFDAEVLLGLRRDQNHRELESELCEGNTDMKPTKRDFLDMEAATLADALLLSYDKEIAGRAELKGLKLLLPFEQNEADGGEARATKRRRRDDIVPEATEEESCSQQGKRIQ